MNLEDPVMVYLARNNIVLHQLTNMLNDADIESHACDDLSPGGIWGGGIIEAFFKAQIWVARKDADRAAVLLADYENRLRERAPSAVQGKEEIEVRCPECHKVGKFPRAHLGTCQECPHCNAFMDVETEETNSTDYS